MFITDKPYISHLLQSTIESNGYKVLKNEFAEAHGFNKTELLLNEDDFIELFKKNEKLCTNSENCIEWINKNLSFSELPKLINVFKDKVKFRDLVKHLYPNFYYRELVFNELKSFDIKSINMPFVVKPSIGFLSLGVYKISNEADWIKTLTLIDEDLLKFKSMFPKAVLNTTNYIIEEYIEGTEYAFDAYFNDVGEPVILNIMRHIFASETDTSDRLYITSQKIIEENEPVFKNFLKEIGDILKIKNFPLHVEVRINNSKIIPIEINPMRFAGWGTTDIAYYAYGINSYEFFLENKKPDWEIISAEKEGLIYSIIVLDKPNVIPTEVIKSFDYEKLKSRFENVLELRETDIKKYPIFGFVFTETREENFSELETILKSDLTEFITTF
jgi:hypothetical protein